MKFPLKRESVEHRTKCAKSLWILLNLAEAPCGCFFWKNWWFCRLLVPNFWKYILTLVQLSSKSFRNSDWFILTSNHWLNYCTTTCLRTHTPLSANRVSSMPTNLFVEDTLRVECMQILFEKCQSWSVQGQLIQLQHRYSNPEKKLMYRRLLPTEALKNIFSSTYLLKRFFFFTHITRK